MLAIDRSRVDGDAESNANNESGPFGFGCQFFEFTPLNQGESIAYSAAEDLDVIRLL